MKGTRPAEAARSSSGIKVLQLGKYYPPVLGGIELHLKDLCESLQKKGVHTECIVSDTAKIGSVGKAGGIKVRRVGKIIRRLPPISPSLPFHLKRVQDGFDIIHLHMPNPSAEVSCLMTRPRNLVVTYHADIVDKPGYHLYIPLQKKVLAMAKKIIVSSEQYVRLSPVLKQFRKKCVVVPLGIDTSIFMNADRSRTKKLRKNFKGPVFLFVGRLVKYKGLQYLLKAMRRVKGTLIIVGNGPLRQLIKEQVKRYGLQGRVHKFFRVGQDALPDFYHAADIFVLPSVTKAEAFGIVQLEAMASGKPVISTRLGTGVESVNIDGKTGLVVPPCSSAALGEAMRRLGAEDKLRARLGTAGKKRVMEHFTRELMADRAIQVYQDILRPGKR
ncbi:glycosyltransferase [Candidatus Woesearchaeota archaeon]|nr:glycosyltransferase [Candidatus Woesearchaeota archaeon]